MLLQARPPLLIGVQIAWGYMGALSEVVVGSLWWLGPEKGHAKHSLELAMEKTHNYFEIYGNKLTHTSAQFYLFCEGKEASLSAPPVRLHQINGPRNDPRKHTQGQGCSFVNKRRSKHGGKEVSSPPCHCPRAQCHLSSEGKEVSLLAQLVWLYPTGAAIRPCNSISSLLIFICTTFDFVLPFH